MSLLEGLREVPEFAAQSKMARQVMRDGKRLAELRAMPRVVNLLIEDRVGINVESNNVSGEQHQR